MRKRRSFAGALRGLRLTSDGSPSTCAIAGPSARRSLVTFRPNHADGGMPYPPVASVRILRLTVCDEARHRPTITLCPISGRFGAK